MSDPYAMADWLEPCEPVFDTEEPITPDVYPNAITIYCYICHKDQPHCPHNSNRSSNSGLPHRQEWQCTVCGSHRTRPLGHLHF